MNPIKPIRTEADYRQALPRVEAIFEATAGTLEFDELDILGTLNSRAQVYRIKKDVIPSLSRNLARFIRAACWRERDSSASSE